jgi:23S rRNA (adenine2030-N6)-methyltransferase
MFGSGLFLINPPWVLREQLAQGLPFLVQTLGQDAGAGFDVSVSEQGASAR